jgi:hypothetical protein
LNKNEDTFSFVLIKTVETGDILSPNLEVDSTENFIFIAGIQNGVALISMKRLIDKSD